MYDMELYYLTDYMPGIYIMIKYIAIVNVPIIKAK